MHDVSEELLVFKYHTLDTNLRTLSSLVLYESFWNKLMVSSREVDLKILRYFHEKKQKQNGEYNIWNLRRFSSEVVLILLAYLLKVGGVSDPQCPFTPHGPALLFWYFQSPSRFLVSMIWCPKNYFRSRLLMSEAVSLKTSPPFSYLFADFGRLPYGSSIVICCFQLSLRTVLSIRE